MVNIKSKFANFIQKALSWLFLILAVFVVAARIIALISEGISLGGVLIAFVVALLLIGFLFLLLYSGGSLVTIAKKILAPLSSAKLLIIILSCAVLLRALFMVALPVDSSIHPDIYVYVNTTRQLAEFGLVETNAVYVAAHPYMFIFSCLFYPMVKLFGASIFVFNITLSIFYIIATLALFDTIKHVFNKNIAFVTALLFTLLPVQLFLSQFLIHENVFIIFTILCLWLFFRVIPSTNKIYLKILLYIGLGILLAFCAKINYFGYLLYFCMLVIVVCRLLRAFCYRYLILCLCGIAALIGTYVGLSLAFKGIENSTLVLPDTYTSASSVDFNWSFYVGFNYDTGGCWSEADRDKFFYENENWSAQEAKAYRDGLLKERLTEVLSSPSKTISLAYRKSMTIWSGNYYSLGYANETIMTDGAREFYNGYVFKPLYIINELSLLAVSFIVVVAARPRKELDEEIVSVYKIILILAALIFLLVEVTTKYSMFIPFILVILGALSYKNFKTTSDNFHNFVNKLFKKKSV